MVEVDARAGHHPDRYTSTFRLSSFWVSHHWRAGTSFVMHRTTVKRVSTNQIQLTVMHLWLNLTSASQVIDWPISCRCRTSWTASSTEPLERDKQCATSDNEIDGNISSRRRVSSLLSSSRVVDCTDSTLLFDSVLTSLHSETLGERFSFLVVTGDGNLNRDSAEASRLFISTNR